MRVPVLAIALCATLKLSHGVSTKMDFGEEESPNVVVTNSSQTTDDDVEVKHTIVVSTKLKNNNRRGVTNNGDTGTLTYTLSDGTTLKAAKDDSGEVPVYKSYKAVETTRIRTPDSRYKTKIYPDAIFVSRNIRDDNDVYPFVGTNPMQWKPANFYNNINYASPDGRVPHPQEGRRRPNNNVKFIRKVTDTREFYCQKCLELSNAQNFRGCPGVHNNNVIQQRSANAWVRETTTPKMNIDGKLAKLN